MRKTLPELACNTCVYSDSLHCDAKCERKASGLYYLVRDICLRCFRVREVHTGGLFTAARTRTEHSLERG